MEEIKYTQALAELETIASKMEAGNIDIDELTVQLKRAQELISLCKDKLQKTSEEVQKLLNDDVDNAPVDA